jgi:cytochrome P450
MLGFIALALGLHSYAPSVGVRSRAAVRLAEAPLPDHKAPEAKREFAAGPNSDLIPEEPKFRDWIDNMPIAMSKSLARQILTSQSKEPEPLPAIWDWFWDAMPFLRAGKVGEPLNLGDVARTFKINIEQIFGNIPAPDKAPLAAADVEGLDFQAIFLALKTYFDRYGSVYKMCFGPKSFMVVNDPVIAKHILRDNSKNYDKGALALVLEDIMGKGLIPADPITWAKRRRAIAPGFHKLYLERMVSEFGQANANLIPQLLKASKAGEVLDVEERFGSLALDVIGKAVFNYDFGSVNEESPVVKAAIRTLGEVEHRALTPAPYWKIPGANKLVPRLVEFNTDMDLLNSVLYRLIDECLASRNPEELEALKKKDYSKVTDPSMLRFLIDLRGEEVDNKQMRDDLITLLIAGHETTAAVLTWLVYALSQHPEELKVVQREIDEVVGDRYPTIEDIKVMPEVQKVIAETLRMWPAPPLFIRCALEKDQWPEGGTGIEGGCSLARANDLFISTYNLGRSPQLWKDPDVFDPQRWDHPFYNDEVKGWKGYDPERRTPGLWVANLEIATDHAMLPFGAGERKCVGDTFALLEAAVSVVMMLRRFEFELEMPNGAVYPDKLDPNNPDKSIGMVGMKSAATIHTATGLFCRIKERFPGETDCPPLEDPNLKKPEPVDEPALV